MADIIPLATLPNQVVSVDLDSVRHKLTLVAVEDALVITVERAGVVIITCSRLMINQPVIPYEYLRGVGNLVLVSNTNDLPDYKQLGITQFMTYVTAAELEA